MVRHVVKSITVFCLVAVSGLSFGGCAGGDIRAKENDYSKIVWPPPPEPARVRLRGILNNSLDVQPITGAAAIKARLLGEADIRTFTRPMRAVSDSRGVIFATNATTKGNSIYVFDTVKQEFREIGRYGKARLSVPLGLDFVRDGDDETLYVGDNGAGRVLAFSPDGTFKFSFGADEDMKTPSGISHDPRLKRLYVADTRNHRILVYGYDGTFQMSFGNTGDERLYYPSDVAVDSAGDVYVADTGSFRVKVFDKNGEYLRSWGGAGDTVGSFSRMKGIAVDSEDHVYVVDAAFSNVQIFDQNGEPLLFFGGPGRAPGKFNLPVGVWIDENDMIYVGDQMNRRVQILDYIPESEVKPPAESGEGGGGKESP